MRYVLALLLSLAAPPALAETLIAARTIRPQEVLLDTDVVVTAANVPGALTRPAEAVGMEARVAIYAGRPIRPGDLGPPAIVERNALVTLRYAANGLSIAAEGRALAAAARATPVEGHEPVVAHHCHRAGSRQRHHRRVALVSLRFS